MISAGWLVTTNAQNASFDQNKKGAKNNVINLKFGDVVESDIDEKSEAEYFVTLNKSDFLSIQVKQQSIDVAVTLLSPDKTRLLTVDEFYKTDSVEKLESEVSGRYAEFRIDSGAFTSATPDTC